LKRILSHFFLKFGKKAGVNNLKKSTMKHEKIHTRF
jgi:hypothetical protein